MPYTVYKFIDGLTNQQGFDGVKAVDIPGGAGIGPTFVTVFWYAVGLVPLSIGTLLGYPSSPAGLDNGPVSAGGLLGANRSWLYDETNKRFNQVGSGDIIVLPDGFWQTKFRVECDRGNEGTRQIQLALSVLDPTDAGDFPGTPPPPEIPDIPVATLIPTTSTVSVSVESNTALITDEDGIAIERRKTDGSNTWEVIASLLSADAPSWPIYPTFIDNLTTNGQFDEPIPGLYRYRARAWKWLAPRTVTAPSPESPEVPYGGSGPVPDLEYTMSGGIDLGGAPLIITMVDPSGIYTLIKDKTNDTLYNRQGDTSVTVKIPDPFIKTGFIP